MTDLHHGHDTVVTDREGPATALIIVLVLALVGFLIWLFAFSGAFGGDDDGDVNIVDRGDRQEQTDTNDLPGGDTDNEPATSP